MTDRTEINLGGSTFDSRLREAGFTTHVGWDSEIAAELVALSKDPVIMASTPRDYIERFASTETAHKWYEGKERSVYSLRSSTGLAGIFWLSSEAYKSAEKTIALRLYEDARGKGLASLFGKTALYHNERWQGYMGDTWLETGAINFVSQRTFKRLDFEEEDDPETPPHRLRMVRLGASSRAILQEEQERR